VTTGSLGVRGAVERRGSDHDERIAEPLCVRTRTRCSFAACGPPALAGVAREAATRATMVMARRAATSATRATGRLPLSPPAASGARLKSGLLADRRLRPRRGEPRYRGRRIRLGRGDRRRPFGRRGLIRSLPVRAEAPRLRVSRASGGAVCGVCAWSLPRRRAAGRGGARVHRLLVVLVPEGCWVWTSSSPRTSRPGVLCAWCRPSPPANRRFRLRRERPVAGWSRASGLRPPARRQGHGSG